MIRVPLHVLADSANVSRDGKLNLLGIFENIHATGFPVTHPVLALVFGIEADTESGSCCRINMSEIIMNHTAMSIFSKILVQC